MELRIGELLIDGGVVTRDQVDHLLVVQQHTGEPFGVLAERLFGVAPADVESAWARQYASLTRTVDPELEVYEPQALELVTRRQAWQFRVLPVRFDHEELMVATTQMHLRRALRFATNVIGVPIFFVMAEPEALGAALCRHYGMPGMTPESVLDDGMDRILSGSVDQAA